jgi:hypothetical protein
MALDKNQLKDLIEETLNEIGYHSDEAVNLILGTIAQESVFGTYLKQLGGGPALGICQMEPNTFKDISDNYLNGPLMSKRLQLKMAIGAKCGVHNWRAKEMVHNLKFAIAMCRVFYLRKPGALPSSIEGMAAYWKKHYNTYLGAGTEEEFIRNYKKYVL